MTEIVMPRLSDSMEEGLILSWLKKEGESVSIGDELVEIETDKASMVYEADSEGVLEILVPEGESRPIGEAIARLNPEGPAPTARPAEAPAEPPTPEPEAEPPATPKPGGQSPPMPDHPIARERVRISPLAARIARERGIDIETVEGSGPFGRIVKADLDRAVPREGTGAAPQPESPEPGIPAKGETTRIELNRTQQLIARRMAEAKATSPHFYLRAEVDMTRAVEVRDAFRSAPDGDAPLPSLNDIVVKASALALRHHPRANSTYRDGGVDAFSRVNIGIAVAAHEALVVPVITDADRKDLRQIATETRHLAERVRSEEITPPELAGGTFTISNLGMYGIRSFEAVINGGQAAILSVGEVSERPAVRDGAMVPASLMEIVLACDHRVLYGAEAAEFLAEIKANLEEPGLLA